MSGSNACVRVRPALLCPLAISGGGGGVLREGWWGYVDMDLGRYIRAGRNN